MNCIDELNGAFQFRGTGHIGEAAAIVRCTHPRDTAPVVLPIVPARLTGCVNLVASCQETASGIHSVNKGDTSDDSVP
jgi:hypothetical protein